MEVMSNIYPTTLVLDGDILCYKAACAIQQTTDWGDDEITTTFSKSEGIRCLHMMVEKILRLVRECGLEINDLQFALSCPSVQNFRLTHVDPEYKANRVGSQKPVGLSWLRQEKVIYEALSTLDVDSKHVLQFQDMEADDYLGIVASTSICLSDDKDLKGCPGWHGKLTDPLEIGYRFEQEANRWLITQTLAGDSTDGIPGLPKVGIKTAQRMIANFNEDLSLWENIVEAYDGDRELALKMFRLVYILRDQAHKDEVDPEEVLKGGI